MLHVIVKGNKFQAARAAADRGIPFVFQEELRGLWTVGLVSDAHQDKVAAWFSSKPPHESR